MRWLPPTLADELGEDAVVRCEGTETRRCGRQVRAHVMVRIQGRPLCDACRMAMVRLGAMTKEEQAREVGAPPEVVEKAQRMDAARRERQGRAE